MVSIIIPIYNVERYLDRCIESVCSQTYKDLEIILVDDGSLDSCPQKCDEWKTKDERIKVIHKVNGGLSSARNAALDVAKGEFIYFLDSDDYIDITLLKNVISEFTEEVDLVSFGRYCIDENNRITDIITFSRGIYSPENDYVDFFANILLKYKIGWEAWGCVFRRKIIEEYNIRFADNRKIFAEDLFFSLCYLSHITNIKVLPDVYYYYLCRSDSIMGVDKNKNNLDRFSKLCEEVNEHYKKYNLCELVENFPILYLNVIFPEIKRIKEREHCTDKQLRAILKNSISNQDYMVSNINKLIHNINKYKKYLKTPQDIERINWMYFYKHGISLELSLRNRILYHNSRFKNDASDLNADTIREFSNVNKDKKCIFYLGSKENGDIGDHEISEAIMRLLQNSFKNTPILEVTMSKYLEFKSELLECIKSSDIIVLPGGENFGSLHLFEETIREEIVLTWKDNLKIIFPQTIFFSNTSEGINILKKAETVYTSDNNVIICTRERTSYEFSQKHFSCKILIVPDIILYSPKTENIPRFDQALMCMSNDKEKLLSIESQDHIGLQLSSKFKSVIYFDTQMPYTISISKRISYIKSALNLFSSSKIVITDRLYGMLFAAVTGTPCIAFSNNHSEISDSYEWINNLSYVRLIDKNADFECVLNEVTNNNCNKYDNKILLSYFNLMIKIISESLKE